MTLHVQKSFSEPFGTAGKLYLVGTPIGNLEDMTFRAIKTLQSCDIIAAEDTRQTRKLLTHFEITPSMLFSYHEHNKSASGPELIRYIIEGKNLALVSDAGLPAISDPGSDLVRLAIEAGITVIPIPGPNAALSALIVSGLPTERFTFGGFLPREKKDIRKVLESFNESNGTLLFYESPHRIRKTLMHLEEILGDRSIVLARELTKRHEEFVRGNLQECIEWLEQHPPLGEYCLLVEGIREEERKAEREAWWQVLSLEEHVAHYENEGNSRKDAMKKTAGDRGLTKRDVYNALIE
ncbi:16S rRNA (cytidine(1402)-2'-O)-methyltransferase [Paenibacillus barcinonensis]|uniref:Ribosomal RNA small subunit methyltransferase I n=1 Tax=Paenibacillus barcinonensis TaxID=198119 RepID=A0A2V4VN88_PAEBA|nr:16S rRNA (cytidine(1402)-2'-O)-methyltransferase [Paenibacillus barcinonensis]PYE43778.1 16S rRNA (cytidine1402-2'-O)-methyltransferase [Paenibacillus barcinonensis]QKS57868.1 16S rRNA (cytidine(1402)-2'-O)-methyltransferase [Paenibacillus barcinonensis]